MEIRTMAPRDLEAIAGITAASPEAASWEMSAYEALLQDSDKGEVWVAENEGVVMGFACCRLIEREAELLNLAVDPGWRRKGIGLRLMQHTLAEVKGRGGERIFLEVRASNMAARRLYEQLGFAPVGRRPGYYQSLGGRALTPPPEDALVLALSLDPPISGR
jgi:ribosomal-protein-alanine N-acetyltransferase